MQYLEVKQRSDEWYKARLGKVTASRFKDVIETLKRPVKDENGELYYPYTTKRDAYKKELVAERIVGILGRKDVYVTPEMMWGQMNEDAARVAYMLRTKNKVTPEGFCTLEKNGKTLPVGCSTDGLVNDNGNLEIKSLTTHNHLYEIVKQAEMPDDYKPQVQGQMWITGREWCDFVGHDSRVPVGLDLFACRIERDDDYIMYLESEILKFADEVEQDFKHFLRYLPVCKRTCRACGLMFTDKLALCPDCGSGNTMVNDVLSPPELFLDGIEQIKELEASRLANLPKGKKAKT